MTSSTIYWIMAAINFAASILLSLLTSLVGGVMLSVLMLLLFLLVMLVVLKVGQSTLQQLKKLHGLVFLYIKKQLSLVLTGRTRVLSSVQLLVLCQLHLLQ